VSQLLAGGAQCGKIDQSIRHGMRFANRYQRDDGTPFAPHVFEKHAINSGDLCLP
jgi:hypothetical protein